MCKHEQSGTEADWIRRLQAGEGEAFEGLFDKYRRGLMAYVTQMCGDHALAEDVVQDCFVRLVQHIRRIDPVKGASAWLYRVARNRVLDVIRHRRFELLPGDAMPEGADTRQGDPGAPLMADERRARIRRALDALAPRERDVLMLRFFGDLSFAEIGRVVRRPLGTVLWQARRGLGKLRTALEDERHAM